MKKQHAVSSISNYSTYTKSEKSGLPAHSSIRLEYVQLRPNKEHLLNYVFYCDKLPNKKYVIIRFQRLIDRTFCLSIKQKQDLSEEVFGNSINYTYLTTDNLNDTFAQVIVDFMISQPNALLIVEKDLKLFSCLLKELLQEFKAIFNVKGFRKGYWQNLNPNLLYSAYSLARKKKFTENQLKCDVK